MYEMTERLFDAPDCRINLAEGPVNGAPLVLLHGATSWWRGWEPVLPALTRHFSVYVPDLRGSGRSARTPGRYGVMDMAKDMAALLESIAGPVHLIGHSFGGHVALALSGLCPGQIKSLIIEDIPLSLEPGGLAARDAGPGFAAWLKILARDPGPTTLLRAVQRVDIKLTPERQKARAQCLALLDPEVLEVYVNGRPFENYDPDGLFQALSMPTLLVEADPAVDTRMDEGTGQRAASLSRHVGRATIRGAGHNVHAEAPDAFSKTVLDFLNQRPA